MSLKMGPEDLTTLLLVGGFGTRLRSRVSSSPKPLAAVGNTSFLEVLIKQLQSQGLRRLVMCTGYLGEQIENAFGDGNALGVSIRYSKEESPMGTAGAVNLARPFFDPTDRLLVMNGDSFLEFAVDQLIAFHQQHHGLATMMVVEVEDAGRYGTVEVGEKGRVKSFVEKTGRSTSGLVNAGVYLLNHEVLDYMPDGPASMERDVFPRLIDQGLYALRQNGLFIDIGTPEDYDRAQLIYERLFSTACKNQNSGKAVE